MKRCCSLCSPDCFQSPTRRRAALLTVLFMLSVLLSVVPSYAQAIFNVYSVREGLSQSTVFSIVQDPQGFMWFGTQDGLNKFDGYSFTTYKTDPSDSTTVSGKAVQALATTPQGDLWVGTASNGLNRFDRASETFTRYIHAPYDTTTISSDVITTLAIDASGTLWVGTGGSGINRFDADTQTFKRYATSPEPGTPADFGLVHTLEVAPNGTLLLGTEAGLVVFDPATETFRTIALDIPGSFPDVIAIEPDPSGGYWVGTAHGLARTDTAFVPQTWYRAEGDGPTVLNNEIILDITYGNRGSLWLGTYGGGLNRLDPATGTVKHYQHDPRRARSLSDNDVQVLFEDDSGTLWVGTESGGVARLAFEEARFTNYQHDPLEPASLNNSDIWAFEGMPDGRLWIATTEVGLNVLDPATGNVRHLNHRPGQANSLQPGLISTLYVAPSEPEVLWIGTEGRGMTRLDTRTERYAHYGNRPDEPSGLRNPRVLALYETRDSTLWVGTEAGLHTFDRTAGTFAYHAHPADSLYRFNAIFSLLQTQDETLWVGTANGLIAYDATAAQHTYYLPDPADPQGMLSGLITTLFEDSRGHLWVGSEMGLHRFVPSTAEQPAHFIRYTVADGLPNEVIYAIEEDMQGHLWISTNLGLSRFDPDNELFRNYNHTDGLPGLEFNQGAVYRAPDGRLYFGSIDGLTSFDPATLEPNLYASPIVITAFRKFDKVVQRDLPDESAITLRYRENFFAFEFAALDYTYSSQNRYAYQLVGFDPGWMEVNTRRYASYTNLDPGTYEFLVRGANSDGVWSQPTSVTIEVMPPWWQTWWFRITSLVLLVGIIAGSVYAWHRSRILRVERLRDEKIAIQRRIADRLEAERLHFARELHDGPIQALQFAGFQFKKIESGLYDASARDELNTLRDTVKDVMQGLRSVCGDLRPPALVHFGLARAIESHAEKFLSSHPGLTIELDLESDQDMLHGRTRLGLFRIYQEALANAAKHAGPCSVQVRLRLSDDHVLLEIEDNGPGFAMPRRWGEFADREHYGLLGAAERAESIGGELYVQSTPGQNTTLRVVAPLALKPPHHVGELYVDV